MEEFQDINFVYALFIGKDCQLFSSSLCILMSSQVLDMYVPLLWKLRVNTLHVRGTDDKQQDFSVLLQMVSEWIANSELVYFLNLDCDLSSWKKLERLQMVPVSKPRFVASPHCCLHFLLNEMEQLIYRRNSFKLVDRTPTSLLVRLLEEDSKGISNTDIHSTQF